MDTKEAALNLFEEKFAETISYCNTNGYFVFHSESRFGVDLVSPGPPDPYFAYESFQDRQMSIRFLENKVSATGPRIRTVSFEYADPCFVDRLIDHITKTIASGIL